MKKRGEELINRRWAVADGAKRRHAKPKVEEDFAVGEEAAEPELVLPLSLQHRGVTADAVPGLMEHAWIHTDVEDKDVSVGLYQLCQVFSFFFFSFFFFF
jgi:hypothetical protein